MHDPSDEEFSKLEIPPTAKKLTEWKNEPQLTDLKNDMEMAKSSHDAQMTKINTWNDLLHVRGKAKPKKVNGRSSVQPKLIRRQAEWRYSALTEPFLGSDRLYNVSPRTFEDVAGAEKNQLLLNYQWDAQVNKIKFVDDYVRSVVDDGTCVIRTGWRRVTTKVKETVPVYDFYPAQDEESLQALQEAINLSLSNPREFEQQVPAELREAVTFYQETGEPTVAVQVGTEEVETDRIIENRPEAEVLDPNNIMIDPSCNGDIDKALFAVYSFETNLADLKEQGDRYKNLDRVNWESNVSGNDPDHKTETPQEFHFKDKARKRVVAHEYWGFYDIHGKGTLVPFVCTWIGDTIIRMEENPFPDGKLPFIVVQYLPVKRELYGETDAELLEDNQNVLGAVTRGMIDLLGRSANSQQGFAKGMLDPLNKRKFENGDDYEFNPNVTPQVGHIQHKYPELPQSALVMLNLQNQDAEALTGVKSFHGGMSGESYGKVAAGIRGMLDASAKREMAILRRLAKGITQLGLKFISMNQAFLSEEEVVRVTNRPQDGADQGQFQTIRRDELGGNFDLKIDISTAEVEQSQVEKLSFMLQTTGPNLGLDFTKIILSKIAHLQRMPDLAQQIENFQPEPDPMQQQLQQLELLERQKKIEKLESEITLNLAKAEEADAKADGEVLSNIEQQTGTTHRRDLERQKAQSAGNQDLEITKSLVRPNKPEERAPDVEAAVGYRQLADQISEVDQPPVVGGL